MGHVLGAALRGHLLRPRVGIAVGAGMGTVLKSSLSVAAQAELQDALHESAVAA